MTFRIKKTCLKLKWVLVVLIRGRNTKVILICISTLLNQYLAASIGSKIRSSHQSNMIIPQGLYWLSIWCTLVICQSSTKSFKFWSSRFRKGQLDQPNMELWIFRMKRPGTFTLGQRPYTHLMARSTTVSPCSMRKMRIHSWQYII